MKELIFEFGVFYFMVWWVMSILYTDSVRIHARLETFSDWIGATTKNGWFFRELGACKFCIESHTATLIAIGYYSYLDYYLLSPEWYILIWGFFFASINSWLRTFLQ